MDPNNQTPNDSPTPEQPFQPFQPQPVAPAPVQPQQPEAQVQPLPPKKSHKGRIASIVSAIVVVLVVAALAIATTTISKNANEAASQYKTDVNAHLNGLLTAPTPEARAKAFDKTVALKEVSFGETLSESYKKAKSFSAKYDAYIKEAGPIMKARYATLDLAPFLRSSADALDADMTTKVPIITDAASAKEADTVLTSFKERGEKYIALSKQLMAYEYDEKYTADRQAYADTLKKMGESWIQLAAVQSEISEKKVQVLEAAGSGQKSIELDLELTTLILNGETKMNKISADYPHDLSDKMWAFVNRIAADEYIQDIAAKAKDMQQKAEALKADAEAL